MYVQDVDSQGRHGLTENVDAPVIVLAQGTVFEQGLIRRRPEKAEAAGCAASLIYSRYFDIAATLVIGVILLPVLVLIALAVFVFSPGPIFFGHKRVGQHRKSFKCYKFRTMYVGAERRLAQILAADPELRREWIADHKLSRDPRITPIGHLLRISSLDELPQLYNVLIGDMSLVGPRPIVEAEIPRYGRYIRHYLRVKPGLTGLWQVTGRSTTTYRRRVATDVLYVRTRSIVRDCSIVIGTIPALITGRGAC